MLKLDSNVLKVEIVPSKPCPMSGEYYTNRALFYKDGSVEIVSYKGEGEDYFVTEAEYREWLETMQKGTF